MGKKIVREKKTVNKDSRFKNGSRPLKPIISFKSLSVKQEAAIDVLSEAYPFVK